MSGVWVIFGSGLTHLHFEIEP